MKYPKRSQYKYTTSRYRVLLISGSLAGVLILASSCSNSADTVLEPTALQYQEVASDLEESWYEAFTLLDRYAQQQIDEWALPGMALALTDTDRLLGVWTYGFANLDARSPVRPDTLFLMGSIGKSFTAIAILQEHERGTIDLHAPVHTYLPWFEIQSDRPPITVHDLLTHTAGIIGGSDLAPHGYYEAWALRHSRLTTGPGERFHYSNVGYKTLGLLLEAVRGEPLGKILEAGILEPLGMAASHGSITAETRQLSAVAYRPLHDDRPTLPGALLVPAGWHEYGAGDGSVTSTPADMAAYLRMLLNGGQGPGGRILSEDSFQLFTGRWTEFADNAYYGYGINVLEADGRTVLTHGGGHLSFVSSIIADLDAGLGAAVMMNAGGPAGAVARFALDLAAAVRRGEKLPALPQAPDRERIEDTQKYTGTYRSDSRQVAVVADGGRLFLEVAPSRGSESNPAPERIRLLRSRNDAFVVDHPEFARFPLVVGREDGDVVEAFHGAEWFRHERYTGPESFELPESWRSYEGHYRSHNPWMSNFRVLARKGRLYLVYPQGSAQQLFPLEDGVFAVGDEDAAERIHFGALAAGRTLSARYVGGDYYRAFNP